MVQESQTTENSKTTILLAEDEPAVRELLQRILKKDGYSILVATDGQEALQIAGEHPADGIDLLVSNVQMPGMTGPDLAKELKQSRPNLRVLLVSAYPQGILMPDSGWSFLQKPFLPKAILDKVRQTLQSTPHEETHSG